jgi:serine/threonine protein kinase
MIYYPHGTLRDVLEETIKAAGEWHAQISEPALWSIFKDLVEAALVLQNGVVSGPARQGWIPIVHRDLKLDNILVDKPDEDRLAFSAFHVMKMADFGLAIRTTEDSPDNPYVFSDVGAFGTPGWRAAEQLQQRFVYPIGRPPRAPEVNGQVPDILKFSEKTNVWGIGAIMNRLMNGTMAWSYPEGEHILSFSAETSMMYSEELINLVKSCHAPRPQDRVSLRQIRSDIDRWTGYSQNPGDMDHARNMRDSKTVIPAWELKVLDEKREYQLGFAKTEVDSS